jgi:hypothetical protein
MRVNDEIDAAFQVSCAVPCADGPFGAAKRPDDDDDDGDGVAAARLLRRLMPMTNVQWANVDFGSIMASLFRYLGETVLQPRENAVAIVALLRTLTARSYASVGITQWCRIVTCL